MPPLDYGPIAHFPKGGPQTVQVTSLLEQSPWSKAARDRLKELSAMPLGWNGYDSPPIRSEAIRESFNLLTELAKLGMPEPIIVPVSGGGIQMEWLGPSSEIEIEVLPGGAMHYLVVDSSDKMLEGEICENGNMAEFTPLTCWYLNGKQSIDELIVYGGSA